MQKIDILMATYNGEKYIENQLLSLFQQYHKNWCLYIHDDGSTDNTIEIIKRYQTLDDRIRLIEDGMIGLGVGKNFLHLLKYVTSEYVIFCDQDDIWLESKLSELLKVMLSYKNYHQPFLAYCDGYAWNENDGILANSISQNHAESLSDFIMFNGGYQGCSIMINRTLVEIAKSYSGYIHHHDDLVSLIAHTFGHVYFLNKQLMLYRQHENAVTGNKKFDRKIFGKVGYLISKAHFTTKQDFYNQFKEKMDMDTKNIYLTYFDIASSKIIYYRFLIALTSSLTWGGNKKKLLAKILIQRLFDK